MTDDTPDVDTDAPASEQFELENAHVTTDEFVVNDSPDGLNEVARSLERLVDRDVTDVDDEILAEFVAACKRLEDAAEDARKEAFEAELDDRVADGESIGPLTKRSGSRRYVTDDAAAFDAVLDAGHDPREVASVNVGDLEDVLGADAERHLGETEYSYFTR